VSFFKIEHERLRKLWYILVNLWSIRGFIRGLPSPSEVKPVKSFSEHATVLKAGTVPTMWARQCKFECGWA